MFFAGIKNYDITRGRVHIQTFIEELNKIDAYTQTKDPQVLLALTKKKFGLVPYPLCNASASDDADEQTPPCAIVNAVGARVPQCRAVGPSVSEERGPSAAREGRGSQRMRAGTRRRLTRGHGGGSSGGHRWQRDLIT
ncbi:IN2-1 protein isoform X1 [Panicum miliaceum]|uniref:IN2-1 protein isoform X1 n=1 Tax=Panicum miliaceum TaxID=4540 RepID=A0A3L6SFY0_PANMI|nr:IN2-1 protein isoform X1 [Panicum miliaceum]